jgi:CheY-like chemotaxis protein
MEEKREIMVPQGKGKTKYTNPSQESDKTPSMIPDRRIILVDDDEVDRQIFTSALEDLNLDVEIIQFSNGVDLIAHLMDPWTEPPYIIFLDLNMPLMNGEECLSDIRREPKLDQVVVIIYSGYYDNLKMETLKKNGADHYILKPNSFTKLKGLIKEGIESMDKK